VSAFTFVHPPHHTGGRVESKRGAAGEHDGIDAVGKAGGRQRVEFARARCPPDDAIPSAPAALLVAHDGHPGPALGVGGVTDHEAEWSEVDAAHPWTGAWVDALAAQRRQSVTPFMEQTWQMKVPQPRQGYPSDARSSLPHDRQIMASLSFSSVIRPPKFSLS
jgi:hypothetical protein